MEEFYLHFEEEQLETVTTPEQMKSILDDLSEDLELCDLTELIEYFESEEKYEICQMLKEYDK